MAIAKIGDAALEKLESYLPELILLDVMMPGIDGFETCKRLKDNPNTQDIPVIFMTALSDSGNKVKGLNAGAVDYITKPINHEEVLARIEIHLQLKNLKTLEGMVNERTTELTETLENLKRAQVQLVQKEKMSSLGKLVAGVAHEINNPVNFIHGNLKHIQQYSLGLLQLVELYQKHYPQPEKEIQDYTEELELEFLQEDLSKIISSMTIGSNRIRQIVLSLRNFSRLDEAEMKLVDIHEGIESTLLILQHKIEENLNHSRIEVLKEYGKLTEVECYAAQLNQVFMNILGNALDAVEAKFRESDCQETAQIRISTEVLNEQSVLIRISDNGCGIPENILSRIFDPFFTTKQPGKGTGLGLSISYQIIVDKHKGKFECDSQVGEGSEFRIEIPIKRSV